MKTPYHLLLPILLVLISCKTTELLISEGKADHAIDMAIKKLDGKQKKTKHIKALEEAFITANDQDIRQISNLQSLANQGDATKWLEVYDLVSGIEKRQEKVRVVLPLKNDSYEGQIDFIETSPLLLEARKGASAHLYDEGSRLLKESKREANKYEAREAYNSFEKIETYASSYKDVESLLDESKELGTTLILLEVIDESGSGDYAYQINERFHNVDDPWTKYHLKYEDNITYDLRSTMSITKLYISPEKEDIRTTTETRQLEKKVVQRTSNGSARLDSMGNQQEQIDYEIIQANLTTIERTKKVTLEAKVDITDYSGKVLIASEYFGHDVIFSDQAMEVQGDRRALAGRAHVLNAPLMATLEEFPADVTMVLEALDHVTKNMISFIEEQGKKLSQNVVAK